MKDYYDLDGIETKDAIAPFLAKRSGYIAWCLGSALKYLARFGFKDGSGGIGDLEKAQDYIDYMIDYTLKESEKHESDTARKPDSPGIGLSNDSMQS